jgi:hypothetical protein
MTFILLIIAFIVYLALAIIETDSGYHFLYVIGLVYVTGHLSLISGVMIVLSQKSNKADKTDKTE